MDWTDQVIARLRALWDEGHSTAEIGERLGCSKNAVIGKAHRLELPPRQSPIIRAAGAPAPKRYVAPPVPQRVAPPPPAAIRPPPEPARPVVQVIVSPPRRAHALPCCWPVGEPGTPDFHFCGAEALPGRPYCEPHCGVAYVKVRDRREADAA